MRTRVKRSALLKVSLLRKAKQVITMGGFLGKILPKNATNNLTISLLLLRVSKCTSQTPKLTLYSTNTSKLNLIVLARMNTISRETITDPKSIRLVSKFPNHNQPHPHPTSTTIITTTNRKIKLDKIS